MNDFPEPELAIHGGVSMYRQIQTQLRDSITTGQLFPGEQLPSVRETAVQLAIKPEIVRRVYEDLEREGFLSSEEGTGTFVAVPLATRQQAHAYQAEFERLCQDILAQAARYGYSSADVIDTIQSFTERRLSS